MKLTNAQWFAFGLTGSVFFTLLVFVFLNVFAIDLFTLVLIMEFFAAFELTRSLHFQAYWKKDLRLFIVISGILFVVVAYFRLASMFSRY